MSAVAASSAAAADAPDLASILASLSGGAIRTEGDVQALLKKIAELEQEKQALAQNLEQTAGKVEKLTEKTKMEMQEKLNSVIAEFIKDLPNAPQEKKDEFMKGMERLVNQTAEDSGVWQVMCCASEAHRNNVMAMQKVHRENEELKKRIGGGNFASEDRRMEIDNGKKRKADVISSEPEHGRSDEGGSFWDAFSVMLEKEHTSKGYTIHTLDQKEGNKNMVR